MALLRSEKYQESVNELKKDSIILQMFEELKKANVSAKHVDMCRAMNTYYDRGGKLGGHIGAVQEALMSLERGDSNERE